MASRKKALLFTCALVIGCTFAASLREDLIFQDNFENGTVGENPLTPQFGPDWVTEPVTLTNTVQPNPLVGDPRNSSPLVMLSERSGGPAGREYVLLTTEQQARVAAGELVTIRFQHYQPDPTRNSIALAITDNTEFDFSFGKMLVDLEWKVNRGVVNYKEALNDFEAVGLTGTAAWDDVEVVVDTMSDSFSVKLNGVLVEDIGFRYDEIDFTAIGSIFISPSTSQITGYTDNFSIFIGDTGDVTVESADFDDDGDVDGADFLKWQRGFGVPSATLVDGDANGNGVVDDSDLAIWTSQFGQPSPAMAVAAAVPEPGVVALTLIGAPLFASRLASRRLALA